jgi:hypothetical protein
MPLTPDPLESTIAGVSLLFLINGLLDFVKPYLPNASSNTWRGLSFFLGVLGVIVEYGRQMQALPGNFGDWVSLVVFGLLVGLAAGNAYDNRQKRSIDNIVKKAKASLAATARATGFTRSQGLTGRGDFAVHADGVTRHVRAVDPASWGIAAADNVHRRDSGADSVYITLEGETEAEPSAAPSDDD